MNPDLPPATTRQNEIYGTAPLAPDPARPAVPTWSLAGVLVLVTLALYWPATGFEFIDLDDQAYVTANVHVQRGLTWENIRWAFMNPVSANWHPVTMLSHMLDCQLFGLKPWGHHFTGILMHALNAALVFVWLQQMTGARWRCFTVAALFAVHPLHVESVAWVAERKDVLSAFFGLLTLILYVRYAIGGLTSGISGQSAAVRGSWSVSQFPSSIFYLLSLACFALGLMSKPMLVTLPFVMLLLDWWPLARIQNSKFKIQNFNFLLGEKIPFFALAATASVLALITQRAAGAVNTMAESPPGGRVGNFLISYCRYLGKTFWPADLAVYYPHPGYWPLGQVLLAGGLLLGITIYFVIKRRHHPFLLVGWLWFLGTLVPVIGLVQVGKQSMADRYTYLPSLGLLILVVWGTTELVRRWRYGQITLAVASSAAIILCIIVTRQQLGYWKDSETLFRHTLAVTRHNYFAHKALGSVLLSRGQTGDAIGQFQAAIRLRPDDSEARNNLGIALLNQGQLEAAKGEFQNAVRYKPENAQARYNLGNLLLDQGDIDEAIVQFNAAIRFKPDDAGAHNNLGVAFVRKNQMDSAISQFQEALRLNPDDPEFQTNLSRALELAKSRRLETR